MNKLTEQVLQILKDYRCTHYEDEVTGDGVPLPDLLAIPDICTYADGVKELELLAEHICDELFFDGEQGEG